MMQLGGLLGDWPEQAEMQFVDEVTSVAVNGHRVLFTCLTNHGETCTVVLAACSANVLRLTLLPSDASADVHLPVPILLEEQLEPIAVDVAEDAEHTTVRLANLTAIVRRKPWELRVLDTRGQLVVGEHRADTNLRGWRRTRWLGYARDPAGLINRCYEAFALGPREHIFGLGEKFMPLDKRGRLIDSWNWNTWGASNERAYKNVPLYLSTAGYGCFVHTTRRVTWDFGSGQESSVSLSFEVEGPSLDVFLIHGPEFPTILERYTALTGRPSVPPRWSFGFWMSYVSYRSWEEVEEVAHGLRERHIPADVIHLDPGWLRPGMFADLEWEDTRFPEPTQHMAKLRAQGFRICLWVQPWIPVDSEVFADGAARGYFARTERGDVYRYVPTVPGNPPRPAAIVDFTNAEARRWYKERLKTLIRQGVAAFKTDFGEAIAEDAVFANGMTGRELHNAYPLVYNACFYEAFAEAGVEPLVWGRSGWAGIQRFPVSWSGDQLCNYASMVCTLWGGLSFGLSGGAFWSHDIGGFEGRPDAELYLRWAQWGLLSSHSRAHGTTRREPWTFGEQAERIFTAFARLRYRLIPYLYSCAHEAAANGMPVMRALVLVDSSDPNTWVADTQYLLGADILVCPVLAPGVDSLRVYMPPGTWYDYWSARHCFGGQWQDLSLTLERIPLFVRGGAVLALGPDEEWVGQHEGEPLTLLVYPDEAGRAASSLRHDGGVTTFTYREGTLTSSGPLPARTLVARLGPSGADIPVR